VEFPYYSPDGQNTTFYAKWDRAVPDGINRTTPLELSEDADDINVEFTERNQYTFNYEDDQITLYAIWLYVIPNVSGYYLIECSDERMDVAVFNVRGGDWLPGEMDAGNAPTQRLTADRKYIVGIIYSSQRFPQNTKDMTISLTLLPNVNP
jgi:hypothetical protein